ncbi:relaxase [Pectobacterium atrosepticum ICMP 1526]|uniref:LPD7 domain-containing protein n=1 Tax=Pectobacterium atrosepticum TaxID=29471 RepID=UPI00065D259B|nr:LPD7 domain-containing protein [Pectobacterium atrosepticum]KMK87240.1 relaxase [Pectobacterium atrosepticum ICMP 1526]
MAIIRVRGGNSGIAEYLINGQKQGRDFNRDELDMRVCLDGNLSLTDNVISTINDSGQERYLHITISFRESDVSIDKMEKIVDDYKKFLLAAYKEEEFNFYAEAHLPKIKTITDRNTGEEKERKPHIHIVIPKKNLLTGNSLDPIGIYNHHEKYHDAIQEGINYKFNLESPKDYVRVGDDHQAGILSRVKADTFKGHRAEIKREVFDSVISNDIKSYSDFISLLKDKYSDVKIRNSGKENEYIAIRDKQGDDYINLKSPLFKRDFIENRKIEKTKLTVSQSDKLIAEWKNKVSKEIKYVNKASSKLRNSYKLLSYSEKIDMLSEREKKFYETTRQYSDRKKTNKKRSAQDRKPRNSSRIASGVSTMRLRELGANRIGYELSSAEREYNSRQSKQSIVLLREVPRSGLADGRERQYERDGLRRSARDTRRIDSVVGRINDSIVNSHDENKNSQIDEFRKIRKLLSGERLLKRLSETHGLNISLYQLKTAGDGSARIGTGRLNLNVSDFLTKEMNFSWKEASVYLRETFDEQVNNEISIQKIKLPHEAWASFNANYRPQYFDKIKEMRKELNHSCKQMRFNARNELREVRNELFKREMSYSERKAALSIAVFEKLKKEKVIRVYQKNIREELSKLEGVNTESLIINYIKNNEGESEEMKKLSDAISGLQERNTFSSFEPEYGVNLKRHLEQIKEGDDFITKHRKRLELNDLTPKSQPNGDVKYKTSLFTTAFVDKGNKIEFPTITDKDKIALGLELAAEKYKGKIQLSGLPTFKEKAIEVAAERGLSVEFRPEKYQKLFEELKQKHATVRSNPERSNSNSASLVMSAASINDQGFNSLSISKNDMRELGKELSKQNISFKELHEASLALPNKQLGELIEVISAKSISDRNATAQEMKITGIYDSESDRTRLLINELPMDQYIQTASELTDTSPDVLKMAIIANDELSHLPAELIDHGFADGQINIPSITINENGRSINNDIRVEFEAMENDSTSFRVIVNGEPMKEVQQAQVKVGVEYFDQKFVDLDQKEKNLLLDTLKDKGFNTDHFIERSNNLPDYKISDVLLNADYKAYANGENSLFHKLKSDDPYYSETRLKEFVKTYVSDVLVNLDEKRAKDSQIISNIISSLAEKGGLNKVYYSESSQSPTAQIERDIKRISFELAKENMIQANYIKNGNTETAKEHKSAVVDFLFDKLNNAKDAKDAKEKLIESGAKIANVDSKKDMVVILNSVPKPFTLNGQGKAFDDSFVPRAVQPKRDIEATPIKQDVDNSKKISISR